ncbi:MAG: patatin-like phospholipase family protein [Blastocatellia bacterium]
MNKPILSTGVRELPKVAIVLGTGGIKAMAGLALFEFLQEQKIPIDLMVGCSGGALACAMMGIGCSPTEARDLGMERLHKGLFTKLDYKALLGIFSSRLGNFDKRSGIINPDRWHSALREYFGDRKIEQLTPRTLIQTTDVDTGEGVVLTRGPLADAVYASCAFFPAFPPTRIDGRYLGDGIYSAPVPVVEAIKRNMDVIIAVDFKEKVTTPPKGFFSCFYHHIDNTMRTLTRSQMFLSIEMHHHEIVILEIDFDHTINPWDVHELPAIVEAGKKSVEKHKAAILSAIVGFTKTPRAAQLRPDPEPPESKDRKEAADAGSGLRRTVVIQRDETDENLSEPGHKGS